MTGPYLYDEEPAPLHTGTPRRRHALIVAVLLGTVLVAVGMVVALPLVRGSAAEQSREVVTVFLAALDAGDTRTAHDLLCAQERARVPAGQVAEVYLRPGTGRVVGTEDGEADGTPVERVTVRWTDGGTSTTSELLVVSESGARICGQSAAG